jgi:hypothetical protein
VNLATLVGARGLLGTVSVVEKSISLYACTYCSEVWKSIICIISKVGEVLKSFACIISKVAKEIKSIVCIRYIQGCQIN